MKITIIGNNLTGLILSKALVNKNINVELLFFPKKRKKTIRTIGITKKNVDYIESNLLKIPKRFINTINEIGIYTEKSNKTEIINFNNKKELFNLIKFEDFFELLEKDLKRSKKFKYTKINNINSLKKKIYFKTHEIIINCDNIKFLNQKLSGNFTKDYKTDAFTFILNHRSIKNNKACQTFTKYGPLAFLPLSSIQTSIVFSIYKNKKDLNEKQIIELVKLYNKKYIIKKFSKIEKVSLKYFSARKYFYGNILMFGDNLHKIHPLAGQGFNITLRDLKILVKEIQTLKDLGLTLNKSFLEKFESNTRPFNFLYLNGINIIEEFFRFDSKFDNRFSNFIPKIINKNKSIKNFFMKVADEGFRFY